MGADDYGQTDVPAGLDNVAAVAAGSMFSLALKRDGTIVGWGTNIAGVLDIPSNLGEVEAIAAGHDHCLALRADGTVASWGARTQVPADLHDVVAVSAGGTFDLALRADGTVVEWGNYAWNPADGWPMEVHVRPTSAARWRWRQARLTAWRCRPTGK
jgi:alpha-tubulin suppressor-like RCC1 family protein